MTEFLGVRSPKPGPLFLHTAGNPLTCFQFSCMLKKGITSLGLNPREFSPHSFRLGAATSAALCGMPDDQIKNMGRWKSSAFKLYIRPRLPERTREKVLFGYSVFLPFVLFNSTGPKRTLIIGDSIVNRASSSNTQLWGGGTVIWQGILGAKIAGLKNRLNRMLIRNEYPTTILLHLGTCGIFKAKTTEIRGRIYENLKDIRNLLPRSRIIWSDILPRQKYDGEWTPMAGKKCTISLNKKARNIFHPTDSSVFANDGLHLSALGCERLRDHWANALVLFFNANPEAFTFLPDYSDQ